MSDREYYGKRRNMVPDNPYAAPSTYKDRFGNTHFNPGNSTIMSRQYRFSGDSMKDIHNLHAITGRGAPGSGETWHHMSDWNPDTGMGTVKLVPTTIHSAHPHMGGSAQVRAVKWDDPQKRAKYGLAYGPRLQERR
jgi:hypothetical protein